VIQCTHCYFALKIRFHWHVEGCRAWESVTFLMIFLLQNGACTTTMELGVKVQAIHRPFNTTSMIPATDRAVFHRCPVAVALQSSILRLIAVVTLAPCSSVQGKWLQVISSSTDALLTSDPSMWQTLFSVLNLVSSVNYIHISLKCIKTRQKFFNLKVKSK
jgi:hypothetical protein